MRTTAFLAALAATVTWTASAQVSEPVTGQCKTGRCDGFQLMERRMTIQSTRGRLLFTRTKAWTVSNGVRADESVETGYVFCSRLLPAVLTEGNGTTTAYLLAPLLKQEYDNNINYYVLYYEACHGAGKEIATGRDDVAVALGYVTSREKPQTLRLSRPQEILAYADREGWTPESVPYGTRRGPVGP